MLRVRLLADDLTGTLDTAAGFIGACGPIPVAWPEVLPGRAEGSLAIDAGTRERDDATAAALSARLAPLLFGADIAFKKADSLLRGPWAAELAGVMRAGPWPRCVVAPAFPFQGRVTRGGRQFSRGADGWTAVSGDIVAALRAAGLDARAASVDAGPLAGVAVYDAETDADLRRIARLDGGGPVLWCGSAGLAAALGGTAPADTCLARPVLGLFGSDRRETEAQLAACAGLRLVLPSGARREAAASVAARLARDGAALVSLRLAAGLAREVAAALIADSFAAVVAGIPRPGTLLVAGGETLEALCLTLGARRLDVTGQIVPGLPRSTLRGGRWDGLPVVSKSGAFGGENVWRDLCGANGIRSAGSSA